MENNKFNKFVRIACHLMAIICCFLSLLLCSGLLLFHLPENASANTVQYTFTSSPIRVNASGGFRVPSTSFNPSMVWLSTRVNEMSVSFKIVGNYDFEADEYTSYNVFFNPTQYYYYDGSTNDAFYGVVDPSNYIVMNNGEVRGTYDNNTGVVIYPELPSNIPDYLFFTNSGYLYPNPPHTVGFNPVVCFNVITGFDCDVYAIDYFSNVFDYIDRTGNVLDDTYLVYNVVYRYKSHNGTYFDLIFPRLIVAADYVTYKSTYDLPVRTYLLYGTDLTEQEQYQVGLRDGQRQGERTGYDNGYREGYQKGSDDAAVSLSSDYDTQVRIPSASYNAGRIEEQQTVNISSASYVAGYNAGRGDATDDSLVLSPVRAVNALMTLTLFKVGDFEFKLSTLVYLAMGVLFLTIFLRVFFHS